MREEAGPAQQLAGGKKEEEEDGVNLIGQVFVFICLYVCSLFLLFVVFLVCLLFCLVCLLFCLVSVLTSDSWPTEKSKSVPEWDVMHNRK